MLTPLNKERKNNKIGLHISPRIILIVNKVDVAQMMYHIVLGPCLAIRRAARSMENLMASFDNKNLLKLWLVLPVETGLLAL